MTTLVTGATGTVGSAVVAELHRRGEPVRAFVRDADLARRRLGDAADLAVGDLTDPASIRHALTGADRVFLACGNVPNQVEVEREVIDAAAQTGVRRLVKLSATGAEPGSPSLFWDWHARIEAHLRESGVPSVVLRPTFYMSNLLAYAAAVRQAGALFAPADGAKVAMIDPADVAAVAATALTTAGHEGRTYAITGPEALTFHDVAAHLSAAAGRPIAFVDVPDAAAHEQLLSAGVPGWLADPMIATFGLLRGGVAAATTDTVREVTGRPPGGLRAFAGRHADAFRDG